MLWDQRLWASFIVVFFSFHYLACSIRERIAAEEAAKEAALIKQFLDKCAEDDRREAAARSAREEARLRYMAEIAAQRDERLALFEAQKMEEVRMAEESKKREEFKKRVIEEARRKMLAEHAAALVSSYIGRPAQRNR
jgi:pantothenate synthetase